MTATRRAADAGGLQRVGDLELSHDPRWQERAWQINRATWVALAAFLAAAVLGFFGTGPFTDTEEGGVRFERFTRFGAPTELAVTPPASAVEDGRIRIAIASRYLEDVRIDSVTPQPESVESQAGETVYTFSVGDAPGTIVYDLTPREVGLQHAAVRIGSTEPREFTQIVYP